MIWDLLILAEVAFVVLLFIPGRSPSEGHWVRASRRTTYEMSYTHGYQAGYRAGQAESRLPPALWQHMLVLGHPDHHEGSPLQPMAAEVTRWLLRHRPKAGAAIHGEGPARPAGVERRTTGSQSF